MIFKISSNSLIHIKKIPRPDAFCGSQCGPENIILDITLEHSEVTYPEVQSSREMFPHVGSLEESDASKSRPHCLATLCLCFLFAHLLSKGNTYSDQRHPHGLIRYNL